MSYDYAYEVHIANTFKYLHLLPMKEQNIEINNMRNYIKSVNRKNEFNHKHHKHIKKILWLTHQVPE